MKVKKQKIERDFLILFIFLLLLIVHLPSIRAEEYYADIDITVDKSGFVTIDGTTNHPDLLTENTGIYTSKEKNFWLLNITKYDFFSDFTFTLTLPKGASINYIKSSGHIRIEEDQGNLIIKGYGENTNLSIIVQYQLEKTSEILGVNTVDINLILIVIILILVGLFLIVYFKEIDKKSIDKNKTTNSLDENSLKGLNKRQKDIMNLLLKSKIPMTQNDIQKELGIPKASVSRNIRRLELKGLIEKEKIGMSNLIRIKK